MKKVLIFIILAVIFGCNHNLVDIESYTRNLENSVRAGKNIHITGKTFEGDLFFDEMTDPAPTGSENSQSVVSSLLTFENCTFRGKLAGYRETDRGRSTTVFHQNLTFINCEFEDDVTFRGNIFHGDVIISSCFFNGNSNFEETSFRGKTSMRNNHFYKDVRFQNSYFHEDANFYESIFHKDVSFQSCRFIGSMQMSLSKVLGYGDFSLVDCDGPFLMNYSEDNGNFVFDHSSFRKRCEMIALKAARVSLKNCSMDELKMNNSEIQGLLNLENIRIHSPGFDVRSVKSGEVVL